MRLRPEEPADASAVSALHLAAFGDHGVLVNRLVDALRPAVVPGNGLSVVAEDDGVVVGHAMLTRSLLDAPPELVDVQVLSPLAVAPPHQRQGIGRALIAHGLEVLAARGVPAVFLEGSPRYYAASGFSAGAELGFRRPSLRIPPAAFQACRLPAWQEWMTGTLVYSAAFWECDAVGLREHAAGRGQG